jgi:hypothetical protein
LKRQRTVFDWEHSLVRSSVESAFIKPDDPRWGAVLAKCSYGVHHQPAYVSLAAKHEGGEPAAFWARHQGFELLIPLVVREIPIEFSDLKGLRDATTPYGYPAPLIYPLTQKVSPERSFSEEEIACATLLLECLRVESARQGIISVFSRLHPLLSTPLAPFQRCGSLVAHAETVYVDLLNCEAPMLWKQQRRPFKKCMRHLFNQGFTGVIDEFKHLPQFYDMYIDTMRRRRADPFYFFDLNYFENLVSTPALEPHLCSVLNSKGKLVAATLYLGSSGIVEAFLSGCLESYFPLSVSKLCYWFMIEWAKEQGKEFLHLGGGVGGMDDSLLNFKRGFSPLSAPFFTWRLICDEEKYRSAVDAWISENGTPMDPFDPAFFPEYRRPIAVYGCE